jgi:ribosomal protein S18 acetylase RimI-like enzyme
VVSELDWPEYTIVVLYKNQVIAAAFMEPTGYITYIAVDYGWQKSGIGTKMLTMLAKRLPQTNLTLHLSVTNPAINLFQRIGFKTQCVISAFYAHLMETENRSSRSAFFMKLKQEPAKV